MLHTKYIEIRLVGKNICTYFNTFRFQQVKLETGQ